MAKILKKGFVSILLCVLMILGSVLMPRVDSFAYTIEELESRRAQIEAEKEELDEKLEALKNDIEKQQEYLDTLYEQIGVVQGKIDSMNREIQAYNEQIKVLDKSITEKKASISDKFELLKKRLRAIYVKGEASTLEIILNCESIMDFAEKSKILRAITEHDSALIDELSEQVKEITAELTKVQEYKTAVTENKAELEVSQAELSDLYSEAQKVMEEYQLQKSGLDEDHANLENELYDLDDEIAAEKQRQAEEAERKRKEEEERKRREEEERKRKEEEERKKREEQSSSSEAPSSSEPEPSSSEPEPSSSEPDEPSSNPITGEIPKPSVDPTDTPIIGTGEFVWPCPGYYWLSSYWGDGRNHKGIDIAGYGIYGEPVIAADSGVVDWCVHDGWGGGYGNSVFIDHGNGYSTRYGHLSWVVVDYGDYVQRGQVIGYVGSTGDSSGPHLHYEVREWDTPINPMIFYDYYE